MLYKFCEPEIKTLNDAILGCHSNELIGVSMKENYVAGTKEGRRLLFYFSL
jgi:hypothetical protein